MTENWHDFPPAVFNAYIMRGLTGRKKFNTQIVKYPLENVHYLLSYKLLFHNC